MSSRLRPLYDKLYMGIDVALLALNAAKAGRKKAREADPKPNFERDYRDKVKPYWKHFNIRTPKKFWFKTYGDSTTPVDPRYIPDDLWFRRIVPHFNTLLFAQALQDKCLHNLFVPGIQRPKTIVKNVAGTFCDDNLNPLSRADAIARCHNVGRILVKPSVGSGMGQNIRFYDSSTLSDTNIDTIFQTYGRNFILQEKMEQHETLASLNPNSLNTIRVVSFLFHQEVHILSTILRVGGGENEMDNVSQGGYQCTIGPDGRLEKTALTKLSGCWQHVETTGNGTRFDGIVIPSYEKILHTVRAEAAKMAHFKILGWDIAVDPDGEPVLIEYNVIPGQNQGTCGPTFGDLTEEVLAEVLNKVV